MKPLCTAEDVPLKISIPWGHPSDPVSHQRNQGPFMAKLHFSQLWCNLSTIFFTYHSHQYLGWWHTMSYIWDCHKASLYPGSHNVSCCSSLTCMHVLNNSVRITATLQIMIFGLPPLWALGWANVMGISTKYKLYLYCNLLIRASSECLLSTATSGNLAYFNTTGRNL